MPKFQSFAQYVEYCKAHPEECSPLPMQELLALCPEPQGLVLSDRDRAQLLAALTFWTDYGMVNDDEAERDYFTPPEKPLSGDEIMALRDRLNATPALPTPESVIAAAMDDRERKI